MRKIAESSRLCARRFFVEFTAPEIWVRNHAKHDFSWIAKGVAVRARNSYTLRDSGIEQLLFWQKKNCSFLETKTAVLIVYN